MPDVSSKSTILKPSLILPVKQLESNPTLQASSLPPLPEVNLSIPNYPFGGAKVSLELPLQRTKLQGNPDQYIYIFGNKLRFASIEHFVTHLLKAHKTGKALLALMHRGVTFHFWNFFDGTLTPFVPYNSDISTFNGNTSATMRVAERFADDMEKMAPIIGARTALELIASELIIYGQLVLRHYKGEKLIMTEPDSPQTRSVYVLQ